MKSPWQQQQQQQEMERQQRERDHQVNSRRRREQQLQFDQQQQQRRQTQMKQQQQQQQLQQQQLRLQQLANDPYVQLEAEIKRLQAAYLSGQVSRQDLEARQAALTIQDSDGAWWTVDVNTLGWMRNAGSGWAPATPPSVVAYRIASQTATSDTVDNQVRASSSSSTKRWALAFLATLALAVLVVAAFNRLPGPDRWPRGASGDASTVPSPGEQTDVAPLPTDAVIAPPPAAVVVVDPPPGPSARGLPVVLEQTQFIVPGDGVANENTAIGPFCCTGTTITLRDTANRPLGYVYYFASIGQAFDLGTTVIVPGIEILVSGTSDTTSDTAEQLQSSVQFMAADMGLGASRSATAGNLNYVITVEDGRTQDGPDGQQYIDLNSVRFRLDATLVP